DAVVQLQSETERIGVRVHTGVAIQRIEQVRDRLHVVYQHVGYEHAIEADRVVNGAGRIADFVGLDLAAGQVAVESGRISLDTHLRSTSNPAVFVCGDAVATRPRLSPIATYEGRMVGRDIVDGGTHAPDYQMLQVGVLT